jgi:hypothetical protein
VNQQNNSVSNEIPISPYQNTSKINNYPQNTDYTIQGNAYIGNNIEVRN